MLGFCIKVRNRAYIFSSVGLFTRLFTGRVNRCGSGRVGLGKGHPTRPAKSLGCGHLARSDPWDFETSWPDPTWPVRFSKARSCLGLASSHEPWTALVIYIVFGVWKYPQCYMLHSSYSLWRSIPPRLLTNSVYVWRLGKQSYCVTSQVLLGVHTTVQRIKSHITGHHTIFVVNTHCGMLVFCLTPARNHPLVKNLVYIRAGPALTSVILLEAQATPLLRIRIWKLESLILTKFSTRKKNVYQKL